MTKKTQEESEQPAKVYQLDAVDSKVENLTKEMRTSFDQVNKNLNTLIVKSESQVTPQQLSDNVLSVKAALENQVKEEVEKIHLEYRPIKDNNKWLIRFIAGQGIAIVGQIVYFLYVQGSA